MVNRRKNNAPKLGKTSELFFRLSWIGGAVGFCLLLAITGILCLVDAFRPETKEIKIVVPWFLFLVVYFMANLSIFYILRFLIDLIDVRSKEVTKRIGLEQAFIDLAVFLFCWWVIYWAVRELVNYLNPG